MKKLVVAFVVLVITLFGGISSASAATCTKTATATTNLRGFLETLVPGDVACLHAGTYGAVNTWAPMYTSGNASSRITLQGYPGEAKPVIRGLLAIDGDYNTVSGLVFDGPAGVIDGQKQVTLWVDGDHAIVSGNEIKENHQQGIYIETAEDVKIVGNYIHDNGVFADPGRANLDHGIYFASGSGLIADNVIEHNYAFGIHLYPSPHDVVVEHNTIVGHGKAGIIVGAEPGYPAPTNNRIVNNILASNSQNAVTSYGPIGTGNTVQNSIFWANGTSGATTGLTVSGTIASNPRFTSSTNYIPQATSPAIDAALSPYYQSTDYAGTPRPQRAAPDIGAYERPTTAPAVRSHTTARVNDGSAIAVSRPKGVASGDLLLATVVHQGARYATLNPPSGWTAVPETDFKVAGTEARTQLFYKVASASEPASYTFNLAEGGAVVDISGGITAFTGVDPTQPISTSNGSSNSGSYSVPAPALSPAWRNTHLVYVGASGDPATWTPPTGMTERFELSSSGSYETTMEVATQALSVGGATGTRAATMSIWWPSVGNVVALNPR